MTWTDLSSDLWLRFGGPPLKILPDITHFCFELWAQQDKAREKLFASSSAFLLLSPPCAYKNLPVKRQMLTLAVDKSRKTLMHMLMMSMEVEYKCVRNLLVLEMSAVVLICLLISILKTFTVHTCHKGKLPSTLLRSYWKSSLAFVFGAGLHFQDVPRVSFRSPDHRKPPSDRLAPPSQLVSTSHYRASCRRSVTCSQSRVVIVNSREAGWSFQMNHAGWSCTHSSFVTQIKLIAR